AARAEPPEATPATDASNRVNPRNLVIFPPESLLFAARTKYEDRAREQSNSRYSGRGVDLRSGDRSAGCNCSERHQQQREPKESRHFPPPYPVSLLGTNRAQVRI